MREQVALCRGHARLASIGLKGEIMTPAQWTKILETMCRTLEVNKEHFGERDATEAEQDDASDDDDDSDEGSDEGSGTDSDGDEQDSDCKSGDLLFLSALSLPSLCAQVSCAEIPLAMCMHYS